MPRLANIDLANLLVDVRNARLPVEETSQQAALLAVAKEQKTKILNLAAGIRKWGLDPLRPIAVRPVEGDEDVFVVVEGNRRLTALKALESPGIVEPAYDAAGKKRLNKLAAMKAAVPTDPVPCIVFEGEADEEALEHWVTLLHTGPNDGEGLVEWRADEKDRHLSRRGGGSPGGQVLEVVRAATGKEYRAESAKKGIITTITRLVTNPKVRERLGLDLVDGRLASWYPPEEVIKGLVRVVDDLFAGRQNSRTLHNVKAREAYADRLPARSLPSKKTRLAASIALAAPAGLASTKGSPTKRPVRRADPSGRKHLVPSTCHLNITASRTQKLYVELYSTPLEEATNLCAVGLRVLVELSVDDLIEKESLMTDEQMRSTPLAKRMKVAADHLVATGKMPAQLRRAIERVADSGKGAIAASAVTWNQYVHNKYTHPKARELRDEWDEIEPFLKLLWP